MNIPKVLYHGTSQLRWNLIMNTGIISSSQRRFHKCDEINMGYVYLTDNKEEAGIYGLNTYLLDLRMPPYDKFDRLKNMMILCISTSNIRNDIEIDPEQKDRDQEFSVMFMRRRKWPHTTWYRHKGDISRKYIVQTRIMPWSSFDDTTIDIINEAMDVSEWKEHEMPNYLEVCKWWDNPDRIMMEKLKVLSSLS